MKPSFTLIISAVFLAYIGHSMWVIFTIFSPTHCKNSPHCYIPYMARIPAPKLEIQVYTSTKRVGIQETDLNLIWKNSTIDINESLERTINISLPYRTRNNGTLYIHAFLIPKGKDPFNTQYMTHKFAQITAYQLPQSEFFSLVTDSAKNKLDPNTPISHLRQRVKLSVMTDIIQFDRRGIPAEIYKHIRPSPDGDYLPILYIDELAFRTRDLTPLNRSVHEMPFTIVYEPISVGKLRFWEHMHQAIKQLHTYGFSEKDTDEMKGIFADTNFYFLMMTFAVSAFHLLFDFLAFKNDISYWRNRKTMVGLSTRAGVCKTCYGHIAEMATAESSETNDEDENSSNKIEDSYNLVHGYELRPRTIGNYNEQSGIVAVFEDGSQSTCETEMLSQTSNWSDEIHSQDSLEDLNQYLQKHSISPVKYPLRKNITDIQESTARYYKRKANEAIEDVLNAIAPGQSSSLLGLCVIKEPSTSETDIEEIVIRLYNETEDANIRCQLLSSICTNLSKKELLGRIPGLTKYQIDKARMCAAEAGDKTIGLRVVPKKIIRRDRMDKDKLEHCLSFFFDNMFVQIVAHGVREMQLDSGETLEIPDVVRTAFHSTMVQMYEAFCKETNFEPLSTSSLFKILKACPASKRKNLHGLDNITADGISAFDTILKLAEHFNTHEQYKELERKIHESKFYMKTDYKTHIKDFDVCADHCRTYALSHPTDKSLQEICPHEHTIHCDRCNLLFEVEKALQELVNQEIDGTEKDVMKFDLKNAMKHIHYQQFAYVIMVIKMQAPKKYISYLHISGNEDTSQIIVLRLKVK